MKEQLRRLYRSAEQENNRVFLSLLESNPNAELLDLGCGEGGFTAQMGAKIGTQALYGVEGQDKAAKLCEKRGIKTYNLDLNSVMPFTDASFDVVCASQVLEHLRFTDLLVKEVHRILKPDGYAVFSTPNLAVWHNMICIIFGWQLFGTAVSDEVNVGNPFQIGYLSPTTTPDSGFAHTRIFTFRALMEFFQYHGFKIETQIGVGYYPLPVKVGRVFSRIDPRHSLLLTLKVRKS